jgi:hypothetical protein
MAKKKAEPNFSVGLVYTIWTDVNVYAANLEDALAQVRQRAGSSTERKKLIDEALQRPYNDDNLSIINANELAGLDGF